MSKQATKTNNDLSIKKKKIQLRLMSLPKKDTIMVLEAFGGEGVLWNEVKKRTDKKIKILSIDIENYNKVNLKGDNRKFLKGLNLNKYDIIDLDSYGSPSNQLEILFEKKYKGIVHCTFIQSFMGALNKNILQACGYSETMIKKCPTLFYKNGQQKIEAFINKFFNVTKITICSNHNKHYFYFTTA